MIIGGVTLMIVAWRSQTTTNYFLGGFILAGGVGALVFSRRNT